MPAQLRYTDPTVAVDRLEVAALEEVPHEQAPHREVVAPPCRELVDGVTLLVQCRRGVGAGPRPG